MGLREQHKEAKLRAIEQAGRALFAERGFEATTTRDLARHAGVSTGTFFVYFPYKVDLLVHLFLKDIGEVLDAAFATLADELPLVDGLMHVFGKFYEYYARDERLARAFLKELIFLEVRPAADVAQTTLSRHHRSSNELMMRIAALVQRAKMRGELPEDMVELEAAYHFFGAYFWGLNIWLSGFKPASRDQQRWMLERALRALVAGFRQRSA